MTAPAGRQARAPRPAGGVVLAYHRIARSHPDVHGLCVPPELLRAQMEELGRRCRPLPLLDLIRAAASRAIPERAVAVTLDDGYLDALEVASPILSALGIPATFFVTSEGLGAPHEPWWDVLERAFLGGASVPGVLTLDLGGAPAALATSTREERAAAHATVHRACLPMSRAGRDEVLARVRRWSGLALAPRDTRRTLTAEELRRLAARPGHAIGAHTAHHLHLPSQPPDVRAREIAENKAALEGILECPVRGFAYPYGAWDGEAAVMVRAHGFEVAVTAEAGLVRAGGDPMRVPRCEVRAWDRERFARRLDELFAAGG